MKSSLEQSSAATIFWKSGALRSASSRGVTPSRVGRLHHLDAVLVGAGEEEDVVAVEPLEAGDGVGRDRLVGVADVGRAVGIGDRGGDVEFLGAHRRLAVKSEFACTGSRPQAAGRAWSHSCGAGERHEDREHDLLAVKVEVIGFGR